MREEEGQDQAIGHATQGKTTKTGGNHKGRDVRNRTGIYIEHNNANIITRIITNHENKRNVTITNKKNQQARKSGQKHTRHQHTHATNRTSLASSGIGFIQKYEAGPEILVAVGTQDKTSDDNTHGKKQEREKVHLEETRNNKAWDNELKGWVTRTIYGRHGIRNRKSADEQLFTHFRGKLETTFSPALDRDTHLKKSTNFHAIGIIYLSKTKQTQKGEQERRLRKGKMAHPSTPTPRLIKLWKDSFETPLRQILIYLWKAPCDRLIKRREKKEERTKREVRRMGRNAKRFFVQPSLLATLIIIMVTFNQGTKEHTVEAYTRRAPKLQPGQVIFKQIGDTTYRLEYANIAFDLDTQLAERAVTAIRDSLEHQRLILDEDGFRREARHETDKTELTLIINR
jgi:hypothetical protein